ncbi:MAG TPA: hydantoinase/oxoprolinase family protein, partial [Burkholderiales bacterium]|nr:hydantoinase/oxoprolinase family protein [Burkholderiales bacterium]
RTIPNLGIEIMSWSVTVSTKMAPATRARPLAKRRAARGTATRQVFDATQGKQRNAKVYERTQLAAGALIKGPALIAEDQTTTVVTADFDAHVNSVGCLVLDQRRSH